MGSSVHRRLLDTASLSDVCPAEISGLWSTVFFSWLTPLLTLANARPLELDDLFRLNPADRATTATSIFHTQWAREQSSSSSPKLYRAFARGYARPIVLAGVLKVVHLALQFIGPLLLKHLVVSLGAPSKPLSIGLYYTLAVLTSGILQSLALRHYYFVCYKVGLRLRSAVVMAVYDKTLCLASTASTGDVATLISVDAARLQWLVNAMHSLWYTPLQIAVTCVFMCNELGVAFLGGVGVLCLLVPTMSMLTNFMRTYQGPLMTFKDSRLRAVAEVFCGIKGLKLQAWEPSFISTILDHRERELAELQRYATAKAVGATIFNAVPSVVTIAAFGLYVYLGQSLDLGTALTSIALFENIRSPLLNLPSAITSLVEAQVSFDRLQAFLDRDEYVSVTPGPLTSPGILFHSATFCYKETRVLHNLSLRLTQPSLIAVVGRVGAGKSALLHAILGDVQCVRGSVHAHGTIAFVGQEPFIQCATLRDNITFGRSFEHAKYVHAIRVCSLGADLAALPNGDHTELGEKGTTLSGGQRTRVALARAVYQDADVYLLDDPFAAIDSHVGATIFAQCLQTALKDKLVVLVTNGRQFVSACDAVVVLADGAVVAQGPLTDLLADANPSPALTERLASMQSAPETPYGAPAKETVVTTPAESITKNDSAPLVVAEDSAVGTVSLTTYMLWVSASGGWPMLLLLLALYVGSQTVVLAASVWLSVWAQDAYGARQYDYLGVYVSLHIVSSIAYFVRNVALVRAGVWAARRTFATVVSRLVHAPMTFFDTTPLGRILNRLSKDVYVLDEQLPMSIHNVVGTSMSILSTIAMVLVAMPAFGLGVLPLVYAYGVVQRVYVGPSCALQRLDAISRSPLHALFDETLHGFVSIRAYRAQDIWRASHARLVDRNQRAYSQRLTTSRRSQARPASRCRTAYRSPRPSIGSCERTRSFNCT